LLIFGNPAAIRSGERYIDDDLNRLFDGKHQNLAASAEAMRAALLEQYAQRFFAMGEGLRLHLDLHTAIRGSYYPTFAICPAQGEVRYIESLFGLLHAAQINTLLLQDQPAATFSSFSRSRCNARSLTLELGQARPLGHNQQLDLHALHAVLRQLFAGTWPWPDAQASDFRLFRVTREIIKSSADFQLNLDDAVLNFTPLPEGSVVAQDGRQQTIAAGGEHIIFPNREVKVGLRAGLLVAQHLPGSG
jgi:succinylglutamate desuccinylase